jgi:hypothetical protein
MFVPDRTKNPFLIYAPAFSGIWARTEMAVKPSRRSGTTGKGYLQPTLATNTIRLLNCDRAKIRWLAPASRGTEQHGFRFGFRRRVYALYAARA